MLSYDFKTKPYEHQLRALAAARGKVGFAYLMEMRTGKSKTFIDESCMLYEAGEVDCIFLLAPKGVYMNWVKSDPEDPGEFLSHMPDRIYGDALIVEWRAGGGGVRHSKLLNSLLTPRKGIRVLVMNSEALSSGDKGYKFAAAFLRSGKAIMCVDESVDFGDSTSNRTKALIGSAKTPALRDMAKYRRILNGLLSPRGPLQVYSQFEILQKNCLGFSSMYSFRARYAVTVRKQFGGRSVDVVVGYREQDDLAARVAKHSFRVTKQECWDLPPTVYVQRNVELTPEQKRMYDEMKTFALANIESSGTVMTATAVITQMLRLHQLLCGFVVDENGDVHQVPSNRIDEMMRIIDETEDKCIIWSKYRETVPRIVAALREKYGKNCTAEYHGGVERADRMPEIHRFQTDPDCRFIVCTEAGAKGIKLTAAGTAIYYSNGYSLDKRAQSEERSLGAGQTVALQCVDLVAPGTVDESILKVLRQHIDLSSAIMGDGYRKWLI